MNKDILHSVSWCIVTGKQTIHSCISVYSFQSDIVHFHCLWNPRVTFIFSCPFLFEKGIYRQVGLGLVYGV